MNTQASYYHIPPIPILTNEEIIKSYNKAPEKDDFTRNSMVSYYLSKYVKAALEMDGKGWVESVHFTGVEHRYPDMARFLSTMNTPESDRLRFSPDLTACVRYSDKVKHLVFIEVKAGGSVEKRAWKHYLEHYHNTEFIIVVGEVKLTGLAGKEPYARILGWDFVEEIALVDGHDTVSKHDKPWEIDEDGWVKPPGGDAYKKFNHDKKLRAWEWEGEDAKGSWERHCVNRGEKLTAPLLPIKNIPDIVEGESPIY